VADLQRFWDIQCMSTRYDSIGINYSALRKPDPRIAASIATALGTAETVLNVGAGTGSYEPTDRQVTAIEPSSQMIKQRGSGAATVIQGCAEKLPFADASFDASMAVLTVHHWPDKERGLREMRRVTRGRVVLLTFDPSHRGAWLPDYLPELLTLDDVHMPRLSDYERWLGPVQVSPVPIPHDCTDGFIYAYWRRPAAYLDPRIRSGSSSFWVMKNVDEGLARLRDDLASGAWERRYSGLLNLDTCDVGYRLIVAHGHES
jgi:SAM-dependent methyltransferase